MQQVWRYLQYDESKCIMFMMHSVSCSVHHHLKLHFQSLPLSCFSRRSWQLIFLSHGTIIHRDYCESYKASVSEPWLHLTSERSEAVRMNKCSSSQLYREVKVATVTLPESFSSIFQPVHLLLLRLLYACSNSITDFSCDQLPAALLVTAVHWAHSCTRRLQEPFFS